MHFRRYSRQRYVVIVVIIFRTVIVSVFVDGCTREAVAVAVRTRELRPPVQQLMEVDHEVDHEPMDAHQFLVLAVPAACSLDVAGEAVQLMGS